MRRLLAASRASDPHSVVAPYNAAKRKVHRGRVTAVSVGMRPRTWSMAGVSQPGNHPGRNQPLPALEEPDALVVYSKTVALRDPCAAPSAVADGDSIMIPRAVRAGTRGEGDPPDACTAASDKRPVP